MKKIVSFFYLFLVFSCCKNNTEDIYTNKPVEVVFWHAMSGLIGDILNELVDEYNSTHPGVVIKAQCMGNYNALSQKLMASIVAKNQPDIAQAYEAWIARFKAGNLLVPFDSFFTNEKEKFSLFKDFFPVILSNNLYNGELFSLPFNKSTPIIYYNKDMFKKAGLDPEKPPEDWDEFLTVAKIITKKLNVKGFVSGLDTSEIECFIYQNGGRISSEKTPSKMDFASVETVEAIKFLLEMKYLHKVAEYYPGSGYEYQNNFLSQQSAMMITSCVSRTYMADRLVFDWGMAPLLKRKRKGGIIYGTNIVLFNKTKGLKRKAAWDFISWFISPEIQLRWALKTGYLVVRRSCLALPEMKDQLKRLPSLEKIIRQIEDGFFDPRTTEWFLGRQNLGKTIMDIFSSPVIAKECVSGNTEKVSSLVMKELNKACYNTEKWF